MALVSTLGGLLQQADSLLLEKQGLEQVRILANSVSVNSNQPPPQSW